MSAEYTPELLRQFDRITLALSSQNQLSRISARMDIKAFQEAHGKEVCDAMFAELQKRDAKRKTGGTK